MDSDIEQRLIEAILWFAETESETVDEVMRGVLPLRYSGVWLRRTPDWTWSIAVWPARPILGLEKWLLMTEARMRGEPWDHFTITPDEGRAIRQAWDACASS